MDRNRMKWRVSAAMVAATGLAVLACGSPVQRASSDVVAHDGDPHAHWVTIYVGSDGRTMAVTVAGGCPFKIDRIDVRESTTEVRVDVLASGLPGRCSAHGGQALADMGILEGGTVFLHDVLGARAIITDQPEGTGVIYRPPPCGRQSPICQYVSPPPYPRV